MGCHNADDLEGDLSLASYREIQKGGEHGAVLLAGNSDSSRLVRVLTGKTKPAMPPEDERQPTAAEIALLANWIDAGALGPAGAEIDRTILRVPKIKAAVGARRPITDVAWSRDGKQLAVARFKTVQLLAADGQALIRELGDHPGKVNRVAFSQDGSEIIAATGIAGQHGEVRIWRTSSGELVRKFSGHHDTLYAAIVDPTGNLLATAGYDRQIIIWDRNTGQQVRKMTGHNGAVYDLAFSPDGTVLASASADDTVKLWHVATGQRLDTLSQPLKEQFAVAFSPDGRYLVAGGADNRIRVWRWISKEKPRINPLVYARFGHDAAIVGLQFSQRGDRLVTVAEDQLVKIWETEQFTPLHTFPPQPDVTHALALAPSASQLAVGRMDGSLQIYEVPEIGVAELAAGTSDTTAAVAAETPDAPINEVDEAEPNNTIHGAQLLSLPAAVRAVIGAPRDGTADVDCFQFDAQAGQQLVLEIDAARSKSPLDSKIEILDQHGQQIPRVLLQAVRDSYFTFRGKNSDQTDDFRVHNWEEMELNDYLYAGGEVVKFFRYPEGPDSGFWLYPDEGKRYTYFGTTAHSHALHEPCYVVQPHAPGTALIPNGLPVFTIYYENDDDPWRQHGSDSHLLFTAPRTASYHVRVADVRGFGGEDFKYKLAIRPARPGFEIRLNGESPAVPKGGGKRFSLRLQRRDGFDGEVRIDVDGLPPGFHVTSPVIIERGQLKAYGAIYALPDAAPPTEENAKSSRITATKSAARWKLLKY